MNIHELHKPYTHCTRCGCEVGPGSRTTTVEVKDEIWKAGATVSTVFEKVALVFCAKCSPLFDFKRVALGRRLTEDDLVVQEAAESAEIEAARPAVAAKLLVPPDELTAAQIKGWLLEQEASEIFGES
jgi:hypothetical protein